MNRRVLVAIETTTASLGVAAVIFGAGCAASNFSGQDKNESPSQVGARQIQDNMDTLQHQSAPLPGGRNR
jgi:hypothetical protein